MVKGKSLSQKVGQTIVGWVKPTDARPWHTVGFTHPTGSLSTLPGQTLSCENPDSARVRSMRLDGTFVHLFKGRAGR